MTREEKLLLYKDLCARLPYGVIVDNPNPAGDMWDEVINIDTSTKTVTLLYDGRVFSIEEVKPYLRSMSSMTEEEKQKYYDLTHQEDDDVWGKCLFDKMVDFCNERHLDYRGLIEKGLALEAPEGMYKNE